MGKAIYFGINNIIGALDRICQGEAGLYYCVWQNSKSKCFQYNGGDYVDGIEYLKENLEPYADAGYTGDLYLKLHPNPCKHFFTWATEDICTLMICPTSKDITPGQLNGNYSLQQQQQAPVVKGGKLLMTEDQWEERQMLRDLPQTIAGIVALEVAKLNPPQTELEPEIDTMQSVMIGHLKNPQIITKALDILGELIPMLKNPGMAMQQPRQVAGVPGTAQNEKQMEDSTKTATVRPIPEVTILTGEESSSIGEKNYNAIHTFRDGESTVENNRVFTVEQQNEMIAYNEKVDNALRRLAEIPGFDLADDLTALANYAEKNPETFNGLLPIVRNG